MKIFDKTLLKNLYVPPRNSHKGENGKVMVIGGSKLFHAASLWSLEIASKIVDMVFYSSVEENNEVMLSEKKAWRNGIVVPRNKIENYIEEADCILIGPGLPRENGKEKGDDDTKQLTERLLQGYPNKRWVIDGGSLQTIDPHFLPKNAILTPHHQEFQALFGVEGTEESVREMAQHYGCVILLKGPADTITSTTDCVEITGGNAGMTKGGTGDVLAGLAAALYSQNTNPFLVAASSSYINKKAGETLYQRVGYYFNSSDLVGEIPNVMKRLLLD